MVPIHLRIIVVSPSFSFPRYTRLLMFTPISLPLVNSREEEKAKQRKRVMGDRLVEEQEHSSGMVQETGAGTGGGNKGGESGRHEIV